MIAIGGALWSNAYVLLSTTMLLFAANTVAGRLAVGQISPASITCFRWALVTAALLLACGPSLRQHWPVLRRRWRFLTLAGGVGLTGYNLLFYVGAHSTSALNINIVTASAPAAILIGGRIAYGQHARRLQWVGVALSFVGVAVAASHGDLTALGSVAFNIGDLLILLATLLFCVYALALRRRPAMPGLIFFAALTPAAFATSTLPFAAEVASGSFTWPTGLGWLLLIWTAIFPALLAQVFFIRGVELIGAGRAGLFGNLVPIFGSVMAVFALGERFAPYHAVAMGLVLGGILIAEIRRPVAHSTIEAS